MLFPDDGSDPEIEHCLRKLREALLELKKENQKDLNFMIDLLTAVAKTKAR